MWTLDGEGFCPAGMGRTRSKKPGRSPRPPVVYRLQPKGLTLTLTLINKNLHVPVQYCVFHKQPAARMTAREPPSTSYKGGKMPHGRPRSSVKVPSSALRFP